MIPVATQQQIDDKVAMLEQAFERGYFLYPYERAGQDQRSWSWSLWLDHLRKRKQHVGKLTLFVYIRKVDQSAHLVFKILKNKRTQTLITMLYIAMKIDDQTARSVEFRERVPLAELPGALAKWRAALESPSVAAELRALVHGGGPVT